MPDVLMRPEPAARQVHPRPGSAALRGWNGVISELRITESLRSEQLRLRVTRISMLLTM